MGLNSSENKTWIKIKNGKFYKTSDKEEKEPYNSLSGTVTGMRFREETWEGKKVEKLAITVKSGEALFEFNIDTGGSYFSTFLNFFSNVDPTKEVIIVPKKQVKDGKDQYSLLVGQNNVYKAKYTKASPGNLPPMERVTFKGEERWDNTKQVKFWREYISNLDLTTHKEPEIVDEPAHTPPNNVEDELPF